MPSSTEDDALRQSLDEMQNACRFNQSDTCLRCLCKIDRDKRVSWTYCYDCWAQWTAATDLGIKLAMSYQPLAGVSKGVWDKVFFYCLEVNSQTKGP